MMKLFWASVAYLIISLHSAFFAQAQSNKAPGFYENEWVYVSAFHPEKLHYLIGPFNHSPDHAWKFYPFLSVNSYPGPLNQNDGSLWCLKPPLIGDAPDLVRNENRDFQYNQSTKMIDEILPRLKASAQWMVSGKQSFKPIHTYATGPQYSVSQGLLGPSLTPTGRNVNYVGCLPGLRFMAVNAQLSNRQSNFMSIGLMKGVSGKPLVLDLMPMHELVHVYQNNYAPFKLAPVDFKKRGLSWIMEGTAEAIATARTFEINGGHRRAIRKAGPYSDKFHRRFYLLRNYNIPLNLQTSNAQIYSLEGMVAIADIQEGMWKMLGYETNGFWFHVIERYLDNDSGRLTGLFEQLTTRNISNATDEVDIYLNKHDGNLTGLEHVYPQFLAEMTNWWDYRTAGRLSEKKWMDIAFNGCEKFDLSVSKTWDQKPLNISDYAGKCVDLNIDKAAAARLNDVQFVVAGANQNSDEIYLGVSLVTNTRRGTITCYDIVESRGIANAPCLVDPHQGFADWKGGKPDAERTLLRTFNLTDLNPASGSDIKVRVVVVRVPEKHYDVNGKLKRKTLNLTVSLDLASLQAKSKAPSKKRSVMAYGTRQGEGPVAPDGSKTVFDANLEDALRGNVSRTGIPGAGVMMKNMIGFELIDEDEANFTVGFLLKEALKEDVTGPVDVTGMMGDRTMDGKQVVSLQDPQRDSKLEILEYNEGTLRVSGQVNICAAPLGTLMSQETANLCEAGERLSFEVEGSVAFPKLVDGETEFSQHRTESFDAYKDLRIARLTGRSTGIPIPNGSSGDPSAPGGSNSPVSSGPILVGETPNACTIVAPTGTCQCTCEAKACYSEKEAKSQVSPREKACRLSCGKKWAQCSP